MDRVELTTSEVLHALADQDRRHPRFNCEREETHEVSYPPDDRLNVDLFLFGHDRLVHAASDSLRLQCRQDPAKGRLEALEQACVDVVRANSGHGN